MDLNKLKEPFPAEDIQWKPGTMTKDKKKALAMAYVDARAIQDRLDEVCGMDGWGTNYQVVDGGILCYLSIHTSKGLTLKCNGAPETNFEKFKGGLSDAFKRAASTWGIGRYLYKLEAKWEPIETYNDRFSKFKSVPTLPKWALPSGDTNAKVEPKEKPKPIIPAFGRDACAKIFESLRKLGYLKGKDEYNIFEALNTMNQTEFEAAYNAMAVDFDETRAKGLAEFIESKMKEKN